MNRSFLKGKSVHTKIYAAITVLGIILLIGLNMLFTYFGQRGLWYIDMTAEGFYTMSDLMKSTCDEILNSVDEQGNKKQIRITFCQDPDNLIKSEDLRLTYFMALTLGNRYDNLTVETVDVLHNPTAVSMYKTTSRQTISQNDVILSYGAKYRVMDASTFWTEIPSYNGEYRIAFALASLTAINHPKAYFVTDHGETYYDPQDPDSENSINSSAIAELLTERGLSIRTLDLSSVNRVPEDCALLIINNPRKDFVVDDGRFDDFSYVSDTEKLDRFLVGGGSVFVNKANDITLPNFESFLSEWGIDFNNSVIKDTENHATLVGDTAVFGEYETDETEFGYAYYSEYSNISSSPKMVFSNTGYITCSFGDGGVISEPGSYNAEKNFASFIDTYDTAIAYEGTDSSVVKEGAGSKCLAAVCARTFLDPVENRTSYSYLFCTASGEFFSNDILYNGSYANYDVLSNLVSNLSRTDRFVSSDLGGGSLNSNNFGGKHQISTTMSDAPNEIIGSDLKVIKQNSGLSQGMIGLFTALVMIPPLAVLAVGVVVFVKRKFL